MQNYDKQEQQRVAVGPGNAHVTSIRQVLSDASTLRRGTCGPPLLLPPPLLQLLLLLLRVANLLTKN